MDLLCSGSVSRIMLKRIMGKDGHQTPKSTGADTEDTIPDQLADIVYLISTHDAAARQVIEHAGKEGTFGDQGLGIKIGFDVLNVAARVDKCTCQDELEWCCFIRDKVLDDEKLRRTCENIRRGKCLHVSENTPPGHITSSFTSMMHIAAGSNNLDIAKLLLKQNENVGSSECPLGLLPFHVSLKRASTEVIEFLITNTNACKLVPKPLTTDRFYQTIELAHWKGVNTTSLIRFINNTENHSDELIGKLCRLFSCSKLLFLLIRSLLDSSKERLAFRFLEAFEWKSSTEDWLFLVYCVLMDAKDCLRILLKQDIAVEACLNLTGCNLLDIAHAFGRSDCVDILHSSARFTDDVPQHTSPYTFLIKFAAIGLISYKMDSSMMVRLITHLHALGHDVNHQDNLGMTPLFYAIAYPVYNPKVIHTFCSIGADIDAKDQNGRTPLFSAVTKYDSPVADDRTTTQCQRGAIKDILLHNPDVTCSTNQHAVYYAALRDINRFSCLVYINGNYVIKFKANTLDEVDEDREARTFEETFIALSSVALLHEFGFKVNMESLQQIHTDASYLPVLTDCLARIHSVPRTLQSSCRLAIRKEYPGSRLFTVMQNVNLPKTLKKYITKPYILNYVHIERNMDKGEDMRARIDLRT